MFSSYEEESEPVIVEDSEQEPDSAEDNEAMHVAQHHPRPDEAVHHQEDLAQVEPEPLVPDSF